GAGRFVLLYGFLWALVIALASEVVVNVEALEQVAVQGLCCLGRVGATTDDFGSQLVKIRPPWVARLVQRSVGQTVVYEHSLGKVACPREFFARLECQ